jgi:hypothetical protein
MVFHLHIAVTSVEHPCRLHYACLFHLPTAIFERSATGAIQKKCPIHFLTFGKVSDYRVPIIPSIRELALDFFQLGAETLLWWNQAPMPSSSSTRNSDLKEN